MSGSVGTTTTGDDFAPGNLPPSGGPRVRCSGLVVELDGLPVLATIDLSVAPGEFVAVVGPSGCGKSTLLRVLAGLLPPTRGQVDPAPRLGAAALMPQADCLLPWRSLLGNVALGPELAGVPDPRAVALAGLRAFGLDAFAEAYPAALSGGMRQRGALLRTVLAGKPLLLLDEPLGALDSLTRMELQDWLEGLWLGVAAGAAPSSSPSPSRSPSRPAFPAPSRSRSLSPSPSPSRPSSPSSSLSPSLSPSCGPSAPRSRAAGPSQSPSLAPPLSSSTPPSHVAPASPDSHPPSRPSVVLVTHDVAEAVRLADRVVVLTPRPAAIVAEIAVPAPRPRPAAFRVSPDAVGLQARILAALSAGARAPDPAGARLP